MERGEIMYKLALCDDERFAREQILLLLRHFQEEYQEHLEITQFSSGEELLEHMAPDTQILLLDIKMGGLSGMDTARKLRERHPQLCILFITTMTQCALEGYDVHAFGFLVKPVRYESLARQLKDAITMLSHQRGQTISLKRQDSLAVFYSNDILYFEVYGRTMVVVTTHGQETFNIPLRDVERQVAGMGFLRCHKSFLVNAFHIQKIGLTSVFLSNGQEIALSKHRRAQFLLEYSQYIRGLV